MFKIASVFVAVMVSLVLLMPSFLPEDSELHSYLPNTKLNLGLDLQGGIHVLLGVDIQKALEVEVDHQASLLEQRLAEAGLTGASLKVVQGRGIQVDLRREQDDGAFRSLLREDFYRILNIDRWESKTQAIVELDPDHETEIQKLSLEQAREIIRNRVDEFGVTEPIIQIEGDDRILVQLPGIKDPSRAIELIGKTALLEYKIVDQQMGPTELMNLVESVRAEVGFTNNYTRKQLDALNEALQDQLPPETILSFEKSTDVRGGDTTIVPYLLKAKTELTGQALEDARVTTNPQNQRPQVSITFNKAGAEEFEVITANNVGQLLAIMLDGSVISAPRINEKIPAISRGATITLGQGNRQQLLEEARDLALVLRSGALPAPVEILENRTVGASLGQDSIDSGRLSGVLAALFVLGFMLIYYRGAGFVANVSVTISLLGVLAIMALFQATLTLPGLAGIVLTVGMAVDANVIILERVREELKRNETKIRAAVESGYEAAHTAILDANITTAIASIVLFNFGSGPIRGFAVTLLIGIICSYVSAVWFSRWIMEWFLSRRQVKKLSI